MMNIPNDDHTAYIQVTYVKKLPHQGLEFPRKQYKRQRQHVHRRDEDDDAPRGALLRINNITMIKSLK